MPSTYSNLKIQLMATGENATTWGNVTNINLGTAIEEAIAGSADVTFAGSDVTLTLTNTNASQTARNARLRCTGTTAGARNLIVPAIEKSYIVKNDCADAITVKNATGTGIAVPPGASALLFSTGTGVVEASNFFSTLNLGSPLGVTQGGTGLSTLTANNVLLGNGTSAPTFVAPGASGNVLTSNGSTWVSAPNSGGGGGGGVTSITTSGAGLSASASTGAIILQNTGVTALSAGSGISVSGSTGSISITNNGVTSLIAGSGITLSGSTGSITISASGGGGSGTVSLNDGSAASPSLYFTADTNIGLYRPAGGNALGATVNGVPSMYLSDSLGTKAFATALGVDAGSGINNQSCVAIGYSAISSGFSASSSSGCTAVGYQCLRGVVGSNNTAIGSGAGFNATTGTNNTFIGATATGSSPSASNEITLGNSSVTALRCQVTTITSLSDARDKTDIKPLNAGLDFVNALKPVRFIWDMRPTLGMDGEVVQGRKDDPDTGFIAQDLLAVQQQFGIEIPGLVYDTNPDKLEAGYGKLLPVLVKAIQELSAKVSALEAQIKG